MNFQLFIEVRIYSQPERMLPTGALPRKIVHHFFLNLASMAWAHHKSEALDHCFDATPLLNPFPHNDTF